MSSVRLKFAMFGQGLALSFYISIAFQEADECPGRLDNAVWGTMGMHAWKQ